MRKVHLAPRFKLWLILGTTAGVIIAALLALMLAWGPRPTVETQSAATPFGRPSASGSGTGAVVAPWPALAAAAVPSGGLGASSNGNQPVLALSSAVALALSFGALWAARQRRGAGVSEHHRAGFGARSKASPAASL